MLAGAFSHLVPQRSPSSKNPLKIGEEGGLQFHHVRRAGPLPGGVEPPQSRGLSRDGFAEDGGEGVFEGGVGGDLLEGADGGGNVLEIPVVVVVVHDVGKGAEGLHEALGGAVDEKGFDGEIAGDVFPEFEEFGDVFVGVVHVGIVEEGGEVVFLVAHTHSLEVDEPGLVVVQEDVLRLEVAVDESALDGAEAFAEGGEDGAVAEFGPVHAEVLFDEVIDEVVLLPVVGFLGEGGHHLEVFGGLGVGEFVKLFEDAAVVGFAFFPGGVLEGEEVRFAEVFDEGEVFDAVVVEDGGDVEAEVFEKVGDGEEEGVVGAFVGVVEADEGGVVIGTKAQDGAAAGTGLDGLDDDRVGRVELEVGADGGEEDVGGHDGEVVGGQ